MVAGPRKVGKFTLVGKLGAGGMGEVWKARDDSVGRHVALKFLRADGVGDLARFQREASLAARLQHPNIASIYELGTHAGAPYLAMQLVDGWTLKDRAPADRRELVRLLRDAARAVDHAHRQGVLHRDLKPENLMWSAEGRVYVMDFGLARPIEGESELSRSGSILGTPAYMAPEQVDGGTLDARADVWALGVTAYELLARRRAFAGGSLLETLRRVREEEPAPVGARADAPLAAVVGKCLEKDPARRYPTAAALAEDLDRWLAGEPVSARPGWRPGKSARRRLVLAGAVLGVLLAAGGLAAWLVPKSREEARRADAEAGAREEARRREAELAEINGVWTRMVSLREWRRQARRTPGEIRAAEEQAAAEAARLAERYPASPQARYVKARGELYLGRTKEARRSLGEAVGLAADFAPAWELSALMLLQEHQWGQYIWGNVTIDRSQKGRHLLVEAEEAMRKAAAGRGAEHWGLARTAEDRTTAVLVKALKAWYLGGDREAAVRELELETAAAPSEEIARLLSATARAGENLRWAARAVEIAPLSAVAWHDHAMMSTIDRRWAEAEERLTRALEIDPGFAGAWANRGWVRAQGGNPAGGLEDCRKAVELDPKFAPGWGNLGRILERGGDARGAHEAFTRAIDADPEGPGYLDARGCLRSRANDYPGAKADFDRAAELAPRDAEIAYNRGCLLAKWGRPAEAERDFTRSLELDPRSPRAYTNRALVRAELDRVDESEADFEAALRLDPGFAMAWINRGGQRLKRGEAGPAKADLQRARNLLAPGDPLRARVEAWLEEIRRREGE